MSLSSSPSQSQSSVSPFLRRLPVGIRRIILGAFASTQLILAQDKTQDTHQTDHQHGEIAQAINFMHSDDPSEEALDHLIPNDEHIHTIAELHYSRNHATPDGILELGELAGLGIHTRIPISHSAESSTALKLGLHGLMNLSDNQQLDPETANLLQNELNFDIGFIHAFNKRWKISAGLNYIRENSIGSTTHTSKKTHLDDHGHPHTTTHSETSTHEHEYEGLGAYLNMAYKFELSGIFRDKVSAILHGELDESKTGRGNFVSLTLQANRLPITKHLHADAALTLITGRGERYATSVDLEGNMSTGGGHKVCLMPSFALHWVLNKNITLFTSGVFIIPQESKQGFASSFGVSYTF